MRAMEQRAPLLYGATGVGPRPMDGGGSSGGSTYEAVKEEVRQQLQGQLQGMMRELEESRREASSLRGYNWSENAWEKGSGHMQQGLVLGRDGANSCGMFWWGPCRVRRRSFPRISRQSFPRISRQSWSATWGKFKWLTSSSTRSFHRISRQSWSATWGKFKLFTSSSARSFHRISRQSWSATWSFFERSE